MNENFKLGSSFRVLLIAGYGRRRHNVKVSQMPAIEAAC